jgi:hypothetical protein
MRDTEMAASCRKSEGCPTQIGPRRPCPLTTLTRLDAD